MTVAAVYARQSMDVTEGIARQLDRAGAYIELRGWEKGPEYIDNDTSASKSRGPSTGWGRMLADVGRGRFDVVVAVDLDRLLRTTRDLNTLVEKGARVATVDGELDLTTADGEFRATMLAGIARFETRRKAERQIRANEHRVKQGQQSTAPKRRPFGFERDGITHRPAEADALRAAYQAVIEGRSMAWIARKWNDAGFTTSGGLAWRSGAVGHVLTNPRNMGVLSYNGVERGEAPWDPIVPAHTWRRARAILNVGLTGAPRPGYTLLGGLAVCGECGGVIVSGSAHGRRIYTCKAFRHVSRVADNVDELVEEVILARLERDGVVEALSATPDPSAALLDEGDVLRARLDELAGLYADGALTAAQVSTATERIRDRLADVERDLARTDRPEPVRSLLGSGNLREAWQAADMETRRLVVAELVLVTIPKLQGGGWKVFDPESIQIEWRNPTG